MTREQRTVFGEVAEQYDAYRPGYPSAVYDAVFEFGGLVAGMRALEIGAGTGKATTGWIERGLDVHTLEPTPEMAAVLRAKGVTVEETTFETWMPSQEFRLVTAAQAWHWVHGADRYERAASALVPGGTLAVFWNKPQEWKGALGRDNDAVYDRIAPQLTSSVGEWELDCTLDEIAATNLFGAPVKQVHPWTESYTRDQYVQLLGTHSDHRMLPEDQRNALHTAVGEVIDAHGGHVDVVYDTHLYLARRL